MASWIHPKLGPISPLPPRLQPKKVWKHFYNREEQWGCLCEQDPLRLRQEVEELVGVSRDRQLELPFIDGGRWSRVRELLRRHHDEAYGATYLAEMASDETIWTEGMDRKFRHAALTPRSVYLIVELSQRSWVVTAYRPHPPTTGVTWEEEDFRRHGLWKLAREEGMRNMDIVRSATEQLRLTASSAPTGERDLWWLASAVGYGRLLASEPEIASLLPAAEALLTSVDARLKATLARALDWDGILQRLAAGLKDDRPEEMEDALGAAEDLLAVAAPLEEEEAAARFLDRASELLPWIPAEWNHLLARAANRKDLLGGLIAQLWDTVEDALTGALLRQGPPATIPAHRLVDQVMREAEMHPAVPGQERLFERAAALMERLQSSILEALAPAQSWIKGLQPMSPAPAMGAGVADDDRPWELRCSALSSTQPQRVFVIDEEYPGGYEVTDLAQAGDVSLWSLEAPGQVALVVLLISEDLVPGERLEDALAFAEQRDTVAVVTRLVSRPR